jgi:uncharacterized protein (TIGR03067 family)
MFAWALAGTLVLGAPALKTDRKPAEPPAGEWTLVRLESGGIRADERSLPDQFTGRFTATRFRVTFTAHGGEFVGERAAWFRAGGTLEVDFVRDDPTRASKAVWKVEGDTLTICQGATGGPRPSDFTAPEDSGRTLWVFDRNPKD